MTLLNKLKSGVLSGVPLTLAETETMLRVVDVLSRIADNQCTNPQKEARDILRQVYE